MLEHALVVGFAVGLWLLLLAVGWRLVGRTFGGPDYLDEATNRRSLAGDERRT